MAFNVTPSSRRMVMAALLALAMAGAIVRYFAPDPSTTRDVGTLLLVLWLPAVGNMISYVARQLPRSAPPPTDFEAGSNFKAQLTARVEAVPLPAGFVDSLSATDGRCFLKVGRRGFTVRFMEPLARVLGDSGNQSLSMELLRPAAGLPHLAPGTSFHLMLGTQAVAKGHVVSHPTR